MGRRVLRIAFALTLLALLAVPVVAHADELFPIVRCGLEGQEPCKPCDIWATFKRLIDLLLQGITIPVAAFMVVYAGVMMLLAAGNPGKFQQAKDLLTNVFIGIAIILSAWLVTNFLIKSLASGDIANRWYEFTCPSELAGITNIQTTPPPAGAAVTPPPVGITPASCQPAALAAAYGAGASPTNSGQLTALIGCLLADPVVLAMTDQRQLFTSEVGADFLPGKPQERLCNFTHGRDVCGQKCVHKLYSCHYGGMKGRTAQAVDFNWNTVAVAYNYRERTVYPGNKCPADPTPAPSGKPQPTPHPCRIASGESGLFDELYRAAKKRNCSYKIINFEPEDEKAVHTHLSSNDCDSDTTGVHGRGTPTYP